MKILHVVSYFPPAFGFGGPVRVAYQLSKELSRLGHEIWVYTTNAKDFKTTITSGRQLKMDGFNVHRFKILSVNNFKLFKPFITPELITTAKNQIKNFDMIHLHEYRTFQNVVIHHYAKKYGIPYVLQAHGSLPRILTKIGLKKIYDISFGYKLLKDSSKVVAINDVEASQYLSMGVPKDKISILPNGIDVSEYANLPPKNLFKAKYNIEKNKKIVLYLGRIHQIKGIDLLVKAFSEVAKILDNVILVIVGPDEGFLASLKKLIKKLGISENVVITGPLFDKDKFMAYVDSYVYVLPSLYEIWGITALESIACGVPVIVSKTSGVAEVLNYDKELVVDSSSMSLKNALLKILLDDDYHAKFKKKHAPIIQKYNISNISLELEKMYSQIIEANS